LRGGDRNPHCEAWLRTSKTQSPLPRQDLGIGGSTPSPNEQMIRRSTFKVMEMNQVKQELWEIAKSYPTLRGLLQSELNNCTVGEHWAMVICEKVVGIDDAYQSKLDQEAFEDICYDYAKCTKRLPEPADRLL